MGTLLGSSSKLIALGNRGIQTFSLVLPTKKIYVLSIHWIRLAGTVQMSTHNIPFCGIHLNQIPVGSK